MKRWLTTAAMMLATFAMPLVVVTIVLAQGWGWTPTTPAIPVPPSLIAVRTGTGLQAIVDALPAAGGTIQLDPGRFHADLSDTTLPLILTKPVSIVGVSFSATIIASPIWIQQAYCNFENFWVRPTGGDFGIKLFKPGGGVPRCHFKNIFVGGDSLGDPASPDTGIVIDGGILATFDHVTVGSCANDNIFIRASQLPSYSSNQNLFLNCTSNSAGGYGVNIQGSGITGTHFIGGNMEDNTLGAMNIVSAIEGIIDGVDFENFHRNNTNVILLTTCTDWRISNCNFSMTTGSTRVIATQSCGDVIATQNRVGGMTAGTQIASFDESSVACREWGNVLADSNTFFMNRSRLRVGSSDWNAGWQPPLAAFNGLWWVPMTASSGGLIGSWLPNDGTFLAEVNVSTTDLGTQMRRARWTRTADNQNMGPTAFTASQCMFWRGDKQFAGGFYFSAMFRLDTWGSNAGGGASTRLFVGLADNSSGLMTASVDSSTLSGNFIGLYHDGQDKNIFRLVYSDGATVFKTALSTLGGAANTQAASGEAYRFEMWAPAKGGTIYCKLTSINRNTQCGFAQVSSSVGPTATALMGPQCLMGTGTAGSGVFSVANVYVSR